MHSRVHISPTRLRWRYWRGTTPGDTIERGDTIEGGDTLMKVKKLAEFYQGYWRKDHKAGRVGVVTITKKGRSTVGRTPVFGL